MPRLDGQCGKADCREWEGCLEGLVRLSRGGIEAGLRVWGGCMEGRGRLSEG